MYVLHTKYSECCLKYLESTYCQLKKDMGPESDNRS